MLLVLLTNSLLTVALTTATATLMKNELDENGQAVIDICILLGGKFLILWNNFVFSFFFFGIRKLIK